MVPGVAKSFDICRNAGMVFAAKSRPPVGASNRCTCAQQQGVPPGLVERHHSAAYEGQHLRRRLSIEGVLYGSALQQPYMTGLAQRAGHVDVGVQAPR